MYLYSLPPKWKTSLQKVSCAYPKTINAVWKFHHLFVISNNFDKYASIHSASLWCIHFNQIHMSYVYVDLPDLCTNALGLSSQQPKISEKMKLEECTFRTTRSHIGYPNLRNFLGRNWIPDHHSGPDCQRAILLVSWPLSHSCLSELVLEATCLAWQCTRQKQALDCVTVLRLHITLHSIYTVQHISESNWNIITCESRFLSV